MPSHQPEASGLAVDESLYSRQLYVMGHEAQVRCCRHFTVATPPAELFFVRLDHTQFLQGLT